MKLALALVVAAGIGIGLSLPAAKSAAPPPAAAVTGTKDVPVATVLDRAPSGHFLAIADVNDEPIRFIVDTGADTVALTEDDARRAHVAFDPDSFEVVGKGAAGPVYGQEVRIANLVLDGKRATDVRAVVLEGGDMSLLGHTYLRHLDTVAISGDQMTLK